MIDLSLVIPIKDERDNLRTLHERIEAALRPAGWSYEIVFVDDGSIDDSYLVMAELAAVGLPRRVPTAKPWLASVMKSRGLSHAEIARRLHVSDVTVRGWLSRGPKADPRQASLF